VTSLFTYSVLLPCNEVTCLFLANPVPSFLAMSSDGLFSSAFRCLLPFFLVGPSFHAASATPPLLFGTLDEFSSFVPPLYSPTTFLAQFLGVIAAVRYSSFFSSGVIFFEYLLFLFFFFLFLVVMSTPFSSLTPRFSGCGIQQETYWISVVGCPSLPPCRPCRPLFL